MVLRLWFSDSFVESVPQANTTTRQVKAGDFVVVKALDAGVSTLRDFTIYKFLDQRMFSFVIWYDKNNYKSLSQYTYIYKYEISF